MRELFYCKMRRKFIIKCVRFLLQLLRNLSISLQTVTLITKCTCLMYPLPIQEKVLSIFKTICFMRIFAWTILCDLILISSQSVENSDTNFIIISDTGPDNNPSNYKKLCFMQSSDNILVLIN